MYALAGELVEAAQPAHARLSPNLAHRRRNGRKHRRRRSRRSHLNRPAANAPATIPSSRSTAKPICRESSNSPSACPATTASTSTPTTSACWRFARTGTSSATTCSSAAASASRPARRKHSRPSPCRCATSRPTASSISCIAIVKVQRDFGNRADRKVARMKYLIHDWGLRPLQQQSRRVLRRRARTAAADPRPRLQRRHGLARAGRRPAGSTA